MRLVLFAAFLFAAVTSTSAQNLGGAWKGLWIKDSDPLPVTVVFAKSGAGYSGSFDSDELQVAGIPLQNVQETNGEIRFLLRSDDSTTVFDGWLNGDKMSGTLTEGTAKGTFDLTRSTSQAARIQTRDVTFSDDDVTLSGTLLQPATGGPHAAVVLLQGSGAEGRWANRYLAQKFAGSGIAALIYDKRGVGQSTGNWKTVGFDALANDAAAGIRYLRSLPEIDPRRIGIYGHSQGGTIAPLVATRAVHNFALPARERCVN